MKQNTKYHLLAAMASEHVYLREILQRMLVFGIGPLEIKNTALVLYSTCMLGYFSIFIATQIVELFFITDNQEVMENLALTLLYILTWGKIVVCKTRRVKNIIQTVKEYESSILKSDNRIYHSKVIYFQKLNVFLTAVGVITTLPFFIRPIVEDYLNPQEPPFYFHEDVMVYKRRPLPLSSWFPYDKNKYHYTSFFLQVVAVTYAASSLVLTDGLLLGFMLFFSGRLKILHGRISTFVEQFNSGPMVDEKEHANVIRQCAIEHQELIRCIRELDYSMNRLMLLDFGICSVQIAISAFWALVTKPGIQLGVVLIYFTAMLIQLFLFYWFANNVSTESTKIAKAVWECKWYECSQPIKNSLLVIMIRAQKPLSFHVGPFYAMSNEMALAILKTAYSYVAVLSKLLYHK